MNNYWLLIMATPLIPLALHLVETVFNFKWLWTCKVFGWHTPAGGKTSFDGCSLHAICGKCRAKIKQDSNGDWF